MQTACSFYLSWKLGILFKEYALTGVKGNRNSPASHLLMVGAVDWSTFSQCWIKQNLSLKLKVSYSYSGFLKTNDAAKPDIQVYPGQD